MKALILTADGFEDSEFFYPYYRLLEEGFSVEVAAPEAGPVTGKHGYSFPAQGDFAGLDPDAYDLLVLPGGMGPEKVRLDENAVAATRRIFTAGKPVGAICHGAQVLISAGVLAGKQATCYAGIRDDLRAAGADYSDAEVVVDGNLVTSRQPKDLPAFCRELLALAGSREGR